MIKKENKGGGLKGVEKNRRIMYSSGIVHGERGLLPKSLFACLKYF